MTASAKCDQRKKDPAVLEGGQSAAELKSILKVKQKKWKEQGAKKEEKKMAG